MLTNTDPPEASGAVAFGLWCDRDQDALAIQQALRVEWTGPMVRRCRSAGGDP